MSYAIEKIFTDDGSELSTPSFSTTLGQVNGAAYDGRFMWVATTLGIGIYEFWGESSGDEPSVDEIDDLLWQRYTEAGPLKKLKLVTFIKITSTQVTRNTRYLSLTLAPDWTGGAGSTTVGSSTLTFVQTRPDLLVTSEVTPNGVGIDLTPYWITKVGEKMVVSSGANFTRCWIFDIDTQRPESSFAFGTEPGGTTITANSNLCGANGRIWFVNTVFNDATPQRLYNYRLIDSTLASTAINVRPSTNRTWLADGFNGSVYITNYNGVSVTRYDTETGAQVSRIRTNAFPTKIWTDQSRRIFVNSFGGMLTLVDWDDDGVHNDYSCEYESTGTVPAFTSDPTDADKVWFSQVAGKVSRYSLSAKTQLETGSGSDWHIENTGFASPDVMVTVPSRTYTTSTGETRTTRPYMFIGDNNSVKLFALDSFLTRTNYYEVNGQGAVVGGLGYFQEGP